MAPKRPIQKYRCSQHDIADELSGSGSSIGYRRMHRYLLDRGLICRREDVRKLMQQLDPEGVELRRRRHRRKYHAAGPNYFGT